MTSLPATPAPAEVSVPAAVPTTSVALATASATAPTKAPAPGPASASAGTPAPAVVPAPTFSPDAAAAKPPVKATPSPYGAAASGKAVYFPFRPSAASISLLLTPYLRNSLGLTGALPKGLHLMRPPDESQIQLRVAPLFAKKTRRTFGYVAEIKLPQGGGADTPAQIQLVAKIPFRYGTSTAERETSWMLVRVQAFMSKALFQAPARVDSCVAYFISPFSCRSIWNTLRYHSWGHLDGLYGAVKW